MGKNKKRKTQHPSAKGEGPTQAEIWDDSALIRSWNDAIAEYNYYHSLNARGEDIEAILDQAEAEEGQIEDEDEEQAGKWEEVKRKRPEPDFENDDKLEEGELEEDEDGDENGEIVADEINETGGMSESSKTKGAPILAPQMGIPVVASAPPNGSASYPVPSMDSNQTLENIKMAYYWAGYYSGFYDGQRQAQSQPETALPNRPD